jgi:hypothetical protein
MSCLGVGWRARRDSNPRPKRFDLPRDVAPPARARSAPDPCRCRSRASGAAAGILPPGGFIAYAVHQSMMDSTERHCEFVARLATQGPRLQVRRWWGSDGLRPRGGRAVGRRSEGALCCASGGEREPRAYFRRRGRADHYRHHPNQRPCPSSPRRPTNVNTESRCRWRAPSFRTAERGQSQFEGNLQQPGVGGGELVLGSARCAQSVALSSDGRVAISPKSGSRRQAD